MPFKVRTQQCTDSKGEKGTYVVFNDDTGKSVSCHKTANLAKAAARIRNEASKNE